MENRVIRTEEKPRCLLCGAPGGVIYENLRDRLFGAPGKWRLKQCTSPDCGLIWPDPVPVSEDLWMAYQTYYTHAEPKGKLSGLVFGACARAYWTMIKVPAAMAGLLSERREFLTMFLGQLPPGRLLDVGCGDGEFLHRMTQQGWKGKGIDFDDAAIASGKARYGLDLVTGDFQTAEFAERDYDAITLSHVIEHVPDPVGCLEKCLRLLRPGGRLVVTTPNSRSLGHRQFRESWRGLEPPRHLHIFHPALLGEIARRAGLDVVRTGSTAVNADYILNATISIATAPEGAGGVGGSWNIRHAPRSVALQYREHFALRRNPDAGEEAFLIAERSTAPGAAPPLSRHPEPATHNPATR
jgi:2-polyprenyl-3-methyl-5-hydroxy-6-metoxy-1,4-benzoquinol methylase